MLSELWGGFLLGNAAIIGNVCILPLYPGLLSLLASQKESASRRFLGLAVFAGVMTVTLTIGLALELLSRTFSDVLTYVLPFSFVVIAVLGGAMLAGKNPFDRLTAINAPVLRSPAGSAFVYGLALGPMTLPCTGPVLLTAFVLGAGESAAGVAEGIAYFLAFGLGFGWPLVLLPLLAEPLQRRFTSWMTRNHLAIMRLSGALLVSVAAYAFWVDFRDVLPF